MSPIPVFCVLLTLAAAPDAAELVRQLGANDFTARVEAVRALEQMGAAALPALDAAKDAEDPRIRLRVQALREAIAQRSARPADPADAAPARLPRSPSHRGDRGTQRPAPAQSDPGSRARSPAWDGFPGTGRCREDGPGAAAEDHAGNTRPCRSGRRSIGSAGRPGWSMTSNPIRPSVPSRRVPPRPRSRWDNRRVGSGPYRVRIVSPHGTRDGDFLRFLGQNGPEAPGAARVGKSTLKVRMVVVPEPGVLIRPAGATVLDEAVDEAGRAPGARAGTAPSAAAGPEQQSARPQIRLVRA